MTYSDPAADNDDFRQNIELARLQGRVASPSKKLWWRERARFARRKKVYCRILKKLSYSIPLTTSDAKRLDIVDRAKWVVSCAATDRQRIILHYLSEGFTIRAIARLLRVSGGTISTEINAIRARCKNSEGQ